MQLTGFGALANDEAGGHEDSEEDSTVNEMAQVGGWGWWRQEEGDDVGRSCSAVGLLCLHGAIVPVLYVCVYVRTYVRT